MIGGPRYTEGSQACTNALAAAHLGGLRPRCCCTSNGVEMYIARAGTGFVPKRMPYTAGEHATDCLYFEGEPRPRRLVLRRVLGSTTDAESKPRLEARCHELDRLLVRLWSLAQLTHWQPGFSGKRTWAVVRAHLARAAAEIQLSDGPLSRRLFVPEPFRACDAKAIGARRRSEWLALRGDAGKQGVVLAGEVKRLVPRGNGYELAVRHLPDQRLALCAETYRLTSHLFADRAALWGTIPDTRLVMLADLDMSVESPPTLTSLALMTTTRQWLPIADAFEYGDIQRLVLAGWHFEVGPRASAEPGPTQGRTTATLA